VVALRWPLSKLPVLTISPGEVLSISHVRLVTRTFTISCPKAGHDRSTYRMTALGAVKVLIHPLDDAVTLGFEQADELKADVLGEPP